MSHKISVIIPAYNAEKYISKTIESVLQQTYDNFEIIIVNDGSQDNTGAIIKEYQEKDNRIKYIEQENQGETIARNVGMEHATGEYISFLDADDLWMKDALEKLYSKMISTFGCKFVYGRTEEISTSGKHSLVGSKDNKEGYFEDYIHTNNEFRQPFCMDGILVERKLLVDNEIVFPPKIRISGDMGFIIKVLCLTKAYAMTDVMSYYIHNETSVSYSDWNAGKWRDMVIVFDIIRPFVLKHRPIAVEQLDLVRNFVAYRFILTCIRKKCWDEVQRDVVEWKESLEAFSSGTGRFLDKLKCKAIMFFVKYKSVLNIIGKL